MVESRNLITVYFGKFESPYVGSPFLISGNQIYSAIIREKGIKIAKGLKKISHGVFHTILPENISNLGKINYNKKDWKGYPVGDKINLSEKTIEKYNDFFQLRNYHTPFLKYNMTGILERDRIMKHHEIIINSGEKMELFHADRLSFFTIGDNEIELKQFQLGAKRNAGLGLFTISNKYSFDLNSLDYSIFNNNRTLIKTAKQGIMSVLNHTKYGYGEFKLESWGDKGWLIRLTSPLCINSTVNGATDYQVPPQFMKSEGYRKHVETIWLKGKLEQLYCISDGTVFLYDNKLPN